MPLQWSCWKVRSGSNLQHNILFWTRPKHSLLELMVFTVTSSDCKVKKARFYEFLFTLGWRLIGNKSLYKFPAPKHVSFRKYSNLNFRVFTVRDTKIGMLSHWKKPSLLFIFSSLTISRIKRCVYVHVYVHPSMGSHSMLFSIKIANLESFVCPFWPFTSLALIWGVSVPWYWMKPVEDPNLDKQRTEQVFSIEKNQEP